jgi:phosphoserine phosphatase
MGFQADLLLQLPIHGLLGALIFLDTPLRELPGILAYAPPPEQPALVVTEDNADIGAKTFRIDQNTALILVLPLIVFDFSTNPIQRQGLLSGDSDYLWGNFLVEQGIVDGEQYERENERFYQEYREGRLDIFEFLRFSLRPLRDNDPRLLGRLLEEFLNRKIDPIIPEASHQLLDKHREAGDELLIITATNAFVTAPIAQRLGVAGEPCFREGKVNRLNRWLVENQMDLKDSWFYSDSHNDIPLLDAVDNPVAVDPDETLSELAKTRGWPIISLRG